MSRPEQGPPHEAQPTGRSAPRRRLDGASLALLLVGLAFGAFSCWLIAAEHFSALVLAPSISAAATGAMHLTKQQAARE